MQGLTELSEQTLWKYREKGCPAEVRPSSRKCLECFRITTLGTLVHYAKLIYANLSFPYSD